MTLTKQDKVIRYLSTGRTLSQESAYNMFGVGNLRATISDIGSLGYHVVRTTGRQGESRYGLTTKKRRRR
tara:strand:- start:3233 stop:3442 length:210 start_codon:yes stop_codon:yes gene_type:complete